jgi:4a-hydroxytetrahydrobiopterin dehydratase
MVERKVYIWEKLSTMWRELDNKLVREFRFKDFQEAFTFLTRVAFLAEKSGHHPAWFNVYNYVRIELSTHDAGDVVTERDRRMAVAIDEILL